ncbi:MAG TPA: hypothetical protein VF407_17635 [Polyangiaceae bacterium]
MSLRPFVSAFTAAALFSFAVPSFADAVPPDVEACNFGEDAVGDSCELPTSEGGGSGTCQQTTCTSLLYSCDAGTDAGDADVDADVDAAPHGGPCGSTTYACTKCVADGTPKTDAGPNADAGPVVGHDISEDGDDSGGCSASGSQATGGFFSMMIAASIFGALFVKSRKAKKED